MITDGTDSSDKPMLTRAGIGIEPGIPLNASQGGIEELRRDIQRLMDIEAVKQLKAAYFRCLDTANFEEIETLFHEEVSVHFWGGSYEWALQGRGEYVESLKKSFVTTSIGHHNGHTPEIQMLSESEATGIWYLSDNMWILNANFLTQGTAVYWDRYLKVDGRWLIKDTKYRRIYEINTKLDENPQLSAHYLAEFGADPPS